MMMAELLLVEATNQQQTSDDITPIVIDRSLRTRIKNERKVEQEVKELVNFLQSRGICISSDVLLNLIECPVETYRMKVFSLKVNNNIIYEVTAKDDHAKECEWMPACVIKGIVHDVILETRKSVACLACVK